MDDRATVAIVALVVVIVGAVALFAFMGGTASSGKEYDTEQVSSYDYKGTTTAVFEVALHNSTGSAVDMPDASDFTLS